MDFISESYRKKLLNLSGIKSNTLEESARIDFLKNDFTERVGRKYDRFSKFYNQSIWNKDKEQDGFVKNIVRAKAVAKDGKILPKQTFIKLMLKKFKELEQTDPSENKQYLNWIMNIYLSGNLLDEDIYKIPEILNLFTKNKEKLPIESRNINTFTNINTLYGVVSKYDSEEEMSSSEKEKLVKLEGADQVYDSPNWKIIIPKTEEAACLYGRNTKWCTASEKSYNRFSYYNKQGPLYILIDKNIKNDRDKMKKLQFHFETEQFMDALDDQIDKTKFFKNNPELIKFFEKAGKIDAAFKIDNMLVTKEEGLNLLKTSKDIIGLIKKKNNRGGDSGYEFLESFFLEIGAKKEFINFILNDKELIKQLFHENLFSNLINSYVKLGIQKEGFDVITSLPWLLGWISNEKLNPDTIEEFIKSIVKLGPEGKTFAKKLMERGGVLWNRLIKTNNVGKYFNILASRYTFGGNGVKEVQNMLKDTSVTSELISKGVSKTTLNILKQFYEDIKNEQAEIYLKNIIN